MKYKDKRDNKAYDNFGMREDEINNLLTYCKSKRKELESNTVDLSIRRNEKMKKNEYGSVFKKIAVASLSIAATGAIVAGVVTYNNTNKNSKDNSIVAKETTTVETEKSTEKETENTTQNTIKKEENKSGKKFEYVCMEICDLKGKVTDDCELQKCNYEIGKAGKHVIFLSRNETWDGYTISIKKDDEFKKVDYAEVSDMNIPLNFCTYGDHDLYFFDVNGLKKIDMKNMKSKYLFKFKDIKTPIDKDTIHNEIEIENINDKYIYISGFISEDDKSINDEWEYEDKTVNFMYAYDEKEDKLIYMSSKDFQTFLGDDMVITADSSNHKYTKDTSMYQEKTIYIEKLEDGKMKVVKKLGERAYWWFDEGTGKEGKYDGMCFSAKNDNKFYYVNFEKSLKSGVTDYSEMTIMTYDFSTNETEKVDSITIPNLNHVVISLWIENITDEGVKFRYNNIDYKAETASYDFNTKKLTHKLDVVENN
ncbi:hypothetical protein [Eubacterium sp.]|uniref:hypothetical protein n=1 Tax=Eubacterium sp. TaxID=142586 RepID=UPI0025CDFB48|nr:hypothetical protein [Eubacterium sp.]MCR5630227.1 hypothetical protein [Eubacterium sp.]